MEIEVLLESSVKKFNGDVFGVTATTPPKDILKAVAPAILEETGINIEEDGFEVQMRQATDNAEVKTCFIQAKPTAG